MTKRKRIVPKRKMRKTKRKKERMKRNKTKMRMKMATTRMETKMRMRKGKMGRTKIRNRKAAEEAVTKKAKNPKTNCLSLGPSSQMSSKFQMCFQKFPV